MLKCPVHDRELVYVESQRMECPVKGCQHAAYNSVPSKEEKRISLPWWVLMAG